MIYFYGKQDEFGWLSNTADLGFYIENRYWRTVEHYYQAQKYAGTDRQEAIRKAKTVRQDRQLGMDRKTPIRDDWEAVKLAVMATALHAKFTADPRLTEMPLATGEEELVEASPDDHFWGCGSDGSGANWLGRLLMELRAELAAQR